MFDRQKFWTLLGKLLVGEHYGKCIVCGKEYGDQHTTVAGEGTYCPECYEQHEQQEQQQHGIQHTTEI